MKYNLIALMMVCNYMVSGQGITFETLTWKEAMQKAKDSDKLMFVDAYAEWCGPCKAMAKNVFTQESVGDFFNQNFINLKLDMEKEDGVSFGHKYPVSAYPTLIFIDGDGKLIKKVVGGQQATGLIAVAQEAMKNNDKSGKYAKKYEDGDRSYDLVYSYIKALNDVDKPSLKISNDFLDSSPNLSESQRLKFVFEAAVESDSRLFDEVIANKSKIIKLVGNEVFEVKCRRACEAGVKKAIEFEMESLMIDAIDKGEKTFPDDIDDFRYRSYMAFYKSSDTKDKYIQAYKSLVKKTGKDPKTLKFVIDDVMKDYKDQPNMISDITVYAETLFGIKKDQETLNLLCGLMVLDKKVDRAITLVNKERSKAEKDGQSVNTYDSLLQYLISKKS